MDFDKDNNEHSQIQHNHGYDLKLANHEPTKLFGTWWAGNASDFSQSAAKGLISCSTAEQILS